MSFWGEEKTISDNNCLPLHHGSGGSKLVSSTKYEQVTICAKGQRLLLIYYSLHRSDILAFIVFLMRMFGKETNNLTWIDIPIFYF